MSLSLIPVGCYIKIDKNCIYGYGGEIAKVIRREQPTVNHIESPGYWIVLNNGYQTYFPNCAPVTVISIYSDGEEESYIESGED